jgi:DNA mismatch endonuclease, patch repair protein
MDVHDRKTRSFNMSRIRGSGTKPEARVNDVCVKLKYSFVRNKSDLPGKPDFVFPRKKTALFVHGCFWHSHSCLAGQKKPVQNSEFWKKKREATIERDARQQAQLEALGYKVHVLWECETKSADTLAERLKQILRVRR